MDCLIFDPLFLGTLMIFKSGTMDGGAIKEFALNETSPNFIRFYHTDAQPFEFGFELLVNETIIVRAEKLLYRDNASLCMRISRDNIYISHLAIFTIPQTENKNKHLRVTSDKKVIWEMISGCQTQYIHFTQRRLFIYLMCFVGLCIVIFIFCIRSHVKNKKNKKYPSLFF